MFFTLLGDLKDPEADGPTAVFFFLRDKTSEFTEQRADGPTAKITRRVKYARRVPRKKQTAATRGRGATRFLKTRTTRKLQR